MFVLKKIITSFIIPPGIFILILFVLGFWFIYRKKKFPGICFFSISVLMWVFSTTPVSDLLLRPLEYKYPLPDLATPQVAKGQEDVLVVLSAGIKEGVFDFSGNSTLTEEGLERTVTAFRLQKKLNIPVIVTGGIVFSTQSEASIAKRFLIDLGVPENKIILEEKSRDTMESALLVKKICDAKKFRTVILVTNAYHMPRSMMMFKKAGMVPIPYPCGFKTSKTPVYYFRDYLPWSGSFGNTARALKEYLGILFFIQ